VSVACKTDTKDLEDRIAAAEQQQATLNDSVQRTQMLIALQVVGGAGLHALDEGAAAGEIPEGAAGGVENALLAVAATEWPADLQAGADGLQAILEELVTALETQDPAQVAGPAADAHEAQHEFEHGAADFIKAAVGLPVEEGEHEEDMTTPEAGETPQDDMTTPEAQ
jgi:hypothetical protein